MTVLPPNLPLVPKSAPTAVGHFYEEFTANVFELDYEREGGWDLSSPDGAHIEVKSAGTGAGWKVLENQIDEYDLERLTFIFWKWRWRKRLGGMTADLKMTHRLWKWLSFNTECGLFIPARFLKRLLDSESVPQVHRYHVPGRFTDHVVVRFTLIDVIINDPAWDDLPDFNVHRVNVESKVYGRFQTSAPLYVIDPAS